MRSMRRELVFRHFKRADWGLCEQLKSYPTI
jgi:hypothetical protein